MDYLHGISLTPKHKLKANINLLRKVLFPQRMVKVKFYFKTIMSKINHVVPKRYHKDTHISWNKQLIEYIPKT